MKRRPRVIAGCLTLMALTFSVAQTMVASTCAPEAVSETFAAAETGPAPGSDCPLMGPHDPGPDGDETDGRHCPFAPAAAETCSAIPLMASPSVVVTFDQPMTVPGDIWLPTGVDLPFEKSLFRPPRA